MNAQNGVTATPAEPLTTLPPVEVRKKKKAPKAPKEPKEEPPPAEEPPAEVPTPTEDALGQAAEAIRASTRPTTPVSAREWKQAARRRWLLRLPSGTTVKMRKVDIGALMMTGVLTPEDANLLADTTASTFPARIQLGQRIATYAIVEPVVVLEEDEDPEHMACGDIPAGDAIALLAWAFLADANPTIAPFLTVVDE